ncbi:hypothetical protein RIF29_18441 [Crotalaria pallida]|uniref:Uncharacterized protein n=1 Tax=Crotalaria pallida TaxID=3830 RepID=A0AAN9FPX7_CROPI
MISVGGGKNKLKKKAEAEASMVPMTWEEKRELAQKEEEGLMKDIEEFNTWVDMIETLNDQQLMEYVKNHQVDSKIPNGPKIKNKVQRKIQGVGKSKSSSSGIMTSVWKFHKENK